MARVAVKLSMTGDEAMKARLKHLAGEQGMRKSLKASAVEVWQARVPEMQERTPIKTGALRASERMRVMVSPKRNNILLTLIAGGAEAPYALRVHENLTAKHKIGGAHFMLDTLLAAANVAAAEIGAKIDIKEAVGP